MLTSEEAADAAEIVKLSTGLRSFINNTIQMNIRVETKGTNNIFYIKRDQLPVYAFFGYTE